MNHKAKIIPSIVLPGTLTISGVAGILAIATTTTTSALTYSSDTDVSFTFNPTLSISLSDTNINIDNLLPGLSSESSPITVHVNSNTPYGYSLFASVGNSTDYNTTSLVHSSNDNSNDNNNNNSNSIPATFTSIATNASLPQLDTDNTWGYSFSNDNGTTWSNYNGLPLYSTVGNNTSTNNPALLIDTKSPADSTESIDFKIAAKASSTQASGTYNNVINFYAVGKPQIFYMQDTGIIKSELKNTGDELQVIDNRDGNIYWIAKQADGNIWMTQNLDLCIGCENTSALTSKNTDLNEAGSGVYIEGYAIVDGIINWDPVSTADSFDKVISGTAVSNWRDDSYVPYSAESNDIYVYAPSPTGETFVYNSIIECVEAGHSVDNCSHYHVGNYYNWSVAIASNNSRDLHSNYTVANNSICPSGWKLPVGRAAVDTATTREFGQLLYAADITSSISARSYNDRGLISLRNSPLYFISGGYVNNGVLKNRTQHGDYWSSTVTNWGGAYYMYTSRSDVDSGAGWTRSDGNSVRCLVRQ